MAPSISIGFLLSKRTIAWWLCLGLILGSSLAGAAAPVQLRQSRQFLVIDERSSLARSPGQLRSRAGEDLVRLDADVLLLSAERIRQVLFQQLKVASEGGGRIQLKLYLALRAEDLIGVVSRFTPRGWEYEVSIPDQVERQKLIRALVGVLLLENANRGQGPKSAELPLWLVEGLAQQLGSSVGPELVYAAVPMGTMFRVVRETPQAQAGNRPASPLDSLRFARQVLQSRRPLSFSELAYPRVDSLVDEALTIYQCSAQLFVAELLRLPNGPAKLAMFLRELPRCWNWQTALLRSFPDEFKSMLDVEKRWSVDALAFIAKDPQQVWSRVACLDRLDDLLVIPSLIRVTTDMLPQRKNLTLQQVILNWDFASQVEVLQGKVAALGMLRLNASPDVLPLVERYQQALAVYLRKRSLAGRSPDSRMQVTYNGPLAIHEAIRDLDALDQQRKALRPEQSLAGDSPTNP